eukprot:SAG22_NODE_1008_length_6054_cov_11.023678_9_plen_116_part_00
MFENWEGDWASRAGGYDGTKPATPLALASMRTWLEARQAGVTAVSSKALSVCCASTVFLSKTVPFRAVLLSQARAEFEAAQRAAGSWWLTGLPTLGNAANDHGGSGGACSCAGRS